MVLIEFFRIALPNIVLSMKSSAREQPRTFFVFSGCYPNMNHGVLVAVIRKLFWFW